MKDDDLHKYCSHCALHARTCPCGTGGARCYAESHTNRTDASTALTLIAEGQLAARVTGYAPNLSYRNGYTY